MALARALGLSLRILIAYEKGTKRPSSETLPKVANALSFPVEFFDGLDLEEPPKEGSSFRALSTLTAKLRNQAWASGTLAIALSDWIHARFELPEPDIPRLQGVDPETAAIAVRGEWGLGERPVRNVIHLLEAHGLRVFSLTEDTAEMDGFSFWRAATPYVFLNTMKSGERSRMDAAHELGHLVLHWKGGAQGRDAEREADLFGSAFLMPQGSVFAEAPKGGGLKRIIEAKQCWGVSVANLTVRMHRLGLLSDWQYRMLFIEISRNGYRTAEPEAMPSETSQVLAKVFAALREEGVSMNQVARNLGLYPKDLHGLVFGLVLTPVEGSPSGEPLPTKKNHNFGHCNPLWR